MSNLFLGIVSVLAIVLLAFVIYVLKIKDVAHHDVALDIPMFLGQMEGIEFDPFPAESIDITNQYECSAETQRKCVVGDFTTLVGCKELLVECHHFENDVNVNQDNKFKFTIPHNTSPKEGYALAITAKPFEKCNSYHGQYALVALNETSKEYMLVCVCTQPGYIGNEHLLGNCTSVYICNGKVDGDINRPLKEIKCKCNALQLSSLEADLPVCKEMTVEKANANFEDWTDFVLWDSRETLHPKYFHKDIANLHVKKLLNPCVYSIHDGITRVPNARFDNVTGGCVTLNYGFPVVNSLLDSDTRQAYAEKVKLDDADLNEDQRKVEMKKYKRVDSVLYTNEYQKVRFTDAVNGQRSIIGLMVNGLGPSIAGFASMPLVLSVPYGVTFGGTGSQASLTLTARPEHFMGPRCETQLVLSSLAFGYKCEFRNAYYADLYGLPRPTYTSVDWGHIFWGYQFWEDVNLLVTRGIRQTYAHGFVFSNETIRAVTGNQIYGVIFVSEKNHDKQDGNGILLFHEEESHKIHAIAMDVA